MIIKTLRAIYITLWELDRNRQLKTMGANHRIQHNTYVGREAYLPKYNFVMEHFFTLWLTVDPLAYGLKGPLGWLPSLRS